MIEIEFNYQVVEVVLVNIEMGLWCGRDELSQEHEDGSNEQEFELHFDSIESSRLSKNLLQLMKPNEALSLFIPLNFGCF